MMNRERPRTFWMKWLRQPNQFMILLIALLGTLLIPPFLIDHESLGVVASVFLSLLLLSALYVFPRRRTFIAACMLAAPALVGRWLLTSVPLNAPFLVFVVLCWVAFLALTEAAILRHVLATSRVTNDTISGAVCGYLLLGVMFAFLYAIIALLYPDSFLMDGKTIPLDVHRLNYHQAIINLIYYSFITLTTVGYGDVTPASAPARALAMLEAVTGQFYVAILVARLVSIRYARWGDEE
jgi:voltage-gated potassium channel